MKANGIRGGFDQQSAEVKPEPRPGKKLPQGHGLKPSREGTRGLGQLFKARNKKSERLDPVPPETGGDTAEKSEIKEGGQSETCQEEPSNTQKTWQEPGSTPKTCKAPNNTLKTWKEPSSTPKTWQEPSSTPKTCQEPSSTLKTWQEPSSTPKTWQEPSSTPRQDAPCNLRVRARYFETLSKCRNCTYCRQDRLNTPPPPPQPVMRIHASD